MPAVDDPSPDGFDWEEMVALRRTVSPHDQAVAMQVTIYNPDADRDGSAGRALADAVGAALKTNAAGRSEYRATPTRAESPGTG